MKHNTKEMNQPRRSTLARCSSAGSKACGNQAELRRDFSSYLPDGLAHNRGVGVNLEDCPRKACLSKDGSEWFTTDLIGNMYSQEDSGRPRHFDRSSPSLRRTQGLAVEVMLCLSHLAHLQKWY